MGYTFVEGKIEGEKEFKGKVFPKTLKPFPGMNTDNVNELVEMVKNEREWLNKTLEDHSAILFKGFGLKSAEEFGRVVDAFQWENLPYCAAMPRSNPRHLVAGRVLVPTLTSQAVSYPIFFHHEMSLSREFPSKILFYCLEPSPEGGETCIIPSELVIDQMEKREPEFVSKISTTGFIHKIKVDIKYEDADHINEPWRWIADSEDFAEAEKRAKEQLMVSEAKFREDGTGEIICGPMNPIRSFKGKRVWFNNIVCYFPKEMDSMAFSDGTEIPESAVETYKKILNENCVNIKWDKGDFLLVDNLLAQHGRCPGKPPRKVLISLCK